MKTFVSAQETPTPFSTYKFVWFGIRGFFLIGGRDRGMEVTAVRGFLIKAEELNSQKTPICHWLEP